MDIENGTQRKTSNGQDSKQIKSISSTTKLQEGEADVATEDVVDEKEEPPEQADPPGKVTGVLALSVFTACLGNGFLFGQHIAVINQPLAHIEKFFRRVIYIRNGGTLEEFNSIPDTRKCTGLSDKLPSCTDINVMVGFLAGIWVVFAMIGALLSTKVADYFGRKKGMMMISVLMELSAVFGYIAEMSDVYELLFLCRVLAGIHNGLCINLNNLYLSEISPTNKRGMIGTMFQLAVTVGILFVQIIGLPQLLGSEERWPLMILLTMVPTIVSVGIFFFCPESPRWMYGNKGDEIGAREALEKLRGTDQIASELSSYKPDTTQSNVKNYSLKELFGDKSLRLNVVIACAVMVAQQWSGIDAVFTFSSRIFETVSIPKDTIPYVVVVTGVVNVLNTVITVPLMEYAGRRKLLLYPTILAMMSFVLMTILLILQAKGDNLTDEEKDKNTALGSVCIITFMAYIIGFGMGLGPVPFILVCEIFRQEPRAAALSLAMVINWTAKFFLVVSFPLLVPILDNYINLPFVVFLALSILFFWKYVPETKGKSYEEIEKMLKKT